MMAHSNYGAALEKQGVEITLIYSGSHKVDGNPYSHLPGDVRETLQSRMDASMPERMRKSASSTGICGRRRVSSRYWRSATNSTSETLAATPKAVKSAYDNAEKRLQKDQNGADIPDIAPPDIPAGFVAVFNSDESSWHLVEDHRGKTVYDVASGDALFISELGPLPENVTWLSPEGEFQKWNGTAWVKDTEAEKLFRIREAEETKNSLMQVASEHIAPLQDAVDLEIATEEENSLLEAWKKYRVLLNRVDTSTAPDIEWPAVPVME